MKSLIIKILKRKTFYATILTIYMINTAMTFNRSNNENQLSEYYKHAKPKSEDTPFKARSVEKIPLIEYAVTHLGKPYKYGSKGPNQFDCSGFTSFVYGNFDIHLPPSSVLQSKVGLAVEEQDLQPGDLVFFKSPTEGVDRIGHVGIVTVANDQSTQFIHSSTHRGVVINDLKTSQHYRARYRGARRVQLLEG